MEGNVLGFIMWAAMGLLMAGLGIRAFFAKKEVGFWANLRPLPMKDVKAYNRAVGKLFIVYGIVEIVLGLPILAGQNAVGVVFSILGVLFETIIIMIVYMLVIQEKYEKK